MRVAPCHHELHGGFRESGCGRDLLDRARLEGAGVLDAGAIDLPLRGATGGHGDLLVAVVRELDGEHTRDLAVAPQAAQEAGAVVLLRLRRHVGHAEDNIDRARQGAGATDRGAVLAPTLAVVRR